MSQQLVILQPPVSLYLLNFYFPMDPQYSSCRQGHPALATDYSRYIICCYNYMYKQSERDVLHDFIIKLAQ